MATLTIRNLPDEVRDALRTRAAERGRSMEAEARELLARAVAGRTSTVELSPRQRMENAQARVREMFGGEPPRGLVDEFITERREAARRGE